MSNNGKEVVMIIAGTTLSTSKGYDLNLSNSPIDHDPDIESDWQIRGHGIMSAEFTANFNFKAADFQAMQAAVVAQADATCFFYPVGQGSGNDYWTGAFVLTGMTQGQELLGTIGCAVSGSSNGAVTIGTVP